MGRLSIYQSVRPHLALAAIFLLCSCAGGSLPQPDRDTGTASGYPLLKQFPDMGHAHIPQPGFPHEPYNSVPATSGPHTPYTAEWGVHDTPVAEEILLHNMEHGGIVIGYRCDNCPELVADLADLTLDYQKMILAPNPHLKTPITLSTWGHALYLERLDTAGLAAIRKFIDAHYGIDHHPMNQHHFMGGNDAADDAADAPAAHEK